MENERSFFLILYKRREYAGRGQRRSTPRTRACRAVCRTKRRAVPETPRPAGSIALPPRQALFREASTSTSREELGSLRSWRHPRRERNWDDGAARRDIAREEGIHSTHARLKKRECVTRRTTASSVPHSFQIRSRPYPLEQ